jgi:hypothetical protein
MQTLKSLKIGLIASCLLLSPIASAKAELKPGTVGDLGQYTLEGILTSPEGIASIAFMASLFKHFSRKPDNSPNRYDLEALKANPSLNNASKFAYYFLIDGIIGNPSKSSSIKVEADGKTILADPGAPARGLYGAISDSVKPMTSTLLFLLSTKAFAKDGIRGLFAFKVGLLNLDLDAKDLAL